MLCASSPVHPRRPGLAEKPLGRRGKLNVLSPADISAAVDEGLSVHTQLLMADSQSDHTLLAYKWGWELFEEFCKGYGGFGPDGRRRKGLKSLPASPDTEAEFVGWMAREGLHPASIELARASVHQKHRATGEPVPDGAKASAVLRGYKRRLRQAGWRPKRSSPARTYDLERWLEPVDLTTSQGLRDRAMITLGYAVAARRRVLCNINITDFREVRRGVFQVNIVRDKGDTDRTVYLEHWGRVQRGRCDDVLCPVCATLAWIEHLAALGAVRGPLFRFIDRHGNVGGVAATTGRAAPDGRLNLRSINKIIDRITKTCGAPLGFTPHSLRAGFATEQYENGADRMWIEDHGGWARGSRAFYVYVREVDAVAHNPLNRLRELRQADKARTGAARAARKGGS